MKATAIVGADTQHPYVAEVRACDAKDHERRLATVLMHWPSGPVEYCPPCAAWMRKVSEAMGVYVHEEEIAPPRLREDARGIDLKGEL